MCIHVCMHGIGLKVTFRFGHALAALINILNHHLSDGQPAGRMNCVCQDLCTVQNLMDMIPAGQSGMRAGMAYLLCFSQGLEAGSYRARPNPISSALLQA